MLTPSIVKYEERPGSGLADVDDGADHVGVELEGNILSQFCPDQRAETTYLVHMSCQPGPSPVPPDAVDRGAQQSDPGPGLGQGVESLQYCVLQLVGQGEDELLSAVF